MDNAYTNTKAFLFFHYSAHSEIPRTIFCSFPPHKFVRWKLSGFGEGYWSSLCVCTNRWVEIMVITLMTWLLCFRVVWFRSTGSRSKPENITKYCNKWRFQTCRKPTRGTLEANACKHRTRWIFISYSRNQIHTFYLANQHEAAAATEITFTLQIAAGHSNAPLQ